MANQLSHWDWNSIILNFDLETIKWSHRQLTYDKHWYTSILVTKHHHPVRLWVPAEHGDAGREILWILYNDRAMLLRIIPHLQRPPAADDSQTGAVMVTPPNTGGYLLESCWKNGDGALLGDLPDEDMEVSTRTSKDVGVGRMPADGCDGLLVLWHDGQEAEFLEMVVQLWKIRSCNY